MFASLAGVAVWLELGEGLIIVFELFAAEEALEASSLSSQLVLVRNRTLLRLTCSVCSVRLQLPSLGPGFRL